MILKNSRNGCWMKAVECRGDQERANAMVKAVEETGIEGFEEPKRYPKIELDEVRLVCWLAVQAEQ